MIGFPAWNSALDSTESEKGIPGRGIFWSWQDLIVLVGGRSDSGHVLGCKAVASVSCLPSLPRVPDGQPWNMGARAGEDAGSPWPDSAASLSLGQNAVSQDPSMSDV